MKTPLLAVPKVGTYTIESVGRRLCRAFLDGKPTSYWGTKDECINAVNRAVRQLGAAHNTTWRDK